MRFAILTLALGLQLLSAETYSVIHENTGWPDGHGTVSITSNGIIFEATKQKNSRRWGWLDIQYFDRISETEFEILTYEDQKRFLGRDRSYRFVITDGRLTDEVFRRVGEELGRPVTNRVVRPQPAVRQEIPVKHLHTTGGCEGTLQFTDKAVYYVTDHKKDAREWILARDVDSVWSANRYQFEIHVYDNNRREFSKTRAYKFDLKEPLDESLYRGLKLKLYSLTSNASAPQHLME